MPNSWVVMVPSELISNSAKASLNSSTCSVDNSIPSICISYDNRILTFEIFSSGPMIKYISLCSESGTNCWYWWRRSEQRDIEYTSNSSINETATTTSQLLSISLLTLCQPARNSSPLKSTQQNIKRCLQITDLFYLPPYLCGPLLIGAGADPSKQISFLSRTYFMIQSTRCLILTYTVGLFAPPHSPAYPLPPLVSPSNTLLPGCFSPEHKKI